MKQYVPEVLQIFFPASLLNMRKLSFCYDAPWLCFSTRRAIFDLRPYIYALVINFGVIMASILWSLHKYLLIISCQIVQKKSWAQAKRTKAKDLSDPWFQILKHHDLVDVPGIMTSGFFTNQRYFHKKYIYIVFLLQNVCRKWVNFK